MSAVQNLLIESLPEPGAPDGPVEYAELTWEERRRPRRRMVTTSGTEIAVALKRGSLLHDGDTLYRSAERTIIVKAKEEPVLRIEPRDMVEAMKVAHHLGNWHRSVQVVEEGVILAEPDSPLALWLKRNNIFFHDATARYHPNLAGAEHD